MSAIPDSPRPTGGLISALRDAHWLDAVRARGYLLIMAAMLAASALVYGYLARSGIDPSGKALGTDFTSFYAASKLALAGEAHMAYDLAAHAAAQNAIFGREIEYSGFLYPPLYLLICLPLAFFPYLAALALWQLSTLALYARAALAFGAGRIGLLPVLAFPAVMLNAGHGQNAFLSAGLFGFGVLWLNTRPVLAGMMFGALAYKPHLGLVIPLVLAVSGRWLSFLSASMTVIALAALSYLAFGHQAWAGFIASLPLASAALEHDLVGAHKMQSAYAAVRVLGGGSGPAMIVQGAVTLGTLAALAFVTWQRRKAGTDRQAETPLMIAACLLTSPFLLDYDLVLLALPMAWLFARAMEDGFRPWEKIALLAGFVLPLVSRALAEAAHLPLAPLVIATIFALVARRALESPAHA